MYRKPKFLEVLHDIRQQMAREGDYDVVRFMRLLRQEPLKPQDSRAVPKPTPTSKPRPPRLKKTQKEL